VAGFNVEEYLKSALGDASGDAVAVGRQFLGAGGSPINLGEGFGGIGTVLGDLLDQFKLPGGGGVTDIFGIVLKALEEFFKSDNFSNVLDKPLKEFMKVLVSFDDADVKVEGTASFFGSFIQAVVKLCVEISAQIVVAIENPLADVSQELFSSLGDLIKKVLETLVDALSDVMGQFPVALRNGPLEALSAVNGLKALLGDLKDSSGATYLQGVLTRVDAVGLSLQELVKVLLARPNHAGTDPGFVLIDKAIVQSTQLIRDVLSSKTPEEALTNLFKDILVFPIDTLIALFKSAQKQKLWAWGELPSMLPVGMLNAWLNDPDHYDGRAPAAVQRQFRVRMVAVADAYVRHQLDVPGQPFAQKMPLNEVDRRESGQALADAVCLFFDTVAHFIFEPECFPLIDVDLHGIEDLGVRFAMLVAREIRITIRAILGLLLRGFWNFSLMNHVLIEFIAVIIQVFFSAMIEGVIRNLTWSLQVVSCHGSALFDDASPDEPTLKAAPLLGGARLVYYWPSAERVANTTDNVDRLWYVALVRNPDVDLPAASYPKPYKKDASHDPADFKYVLGLLRDFGAYIDVAYQRFRIDARFPVTEANDEVTITRAEIIGGRLFVEATTTATFEEPRPVLRAYFCCTVAALRPGAVPGDPYAVEIPIEAAPRCVEVIVLSNRGGVGRRRAVRV